MKKLVFLFSLILSYTIIGITGVSTTPVLADEFTNGDIVTVTPSISETDLNKYNNALQVLEYLRQGGSIDFSNVSDNYTSGDLLDEFADLIDTVGSGIDYYGNNFLNNIFDLSTDTVQLSPNTNLKDRIGQFRSNLPSYLNGQENVLPPDPSPDEDYLNYLDTINNYHYGYGFWWKEKHIQTISNMTSQGYNGFYAPRNDYTNYDSFSYYSNNGIVPNYETSQTFCAYMPLTININSIDNTYYVTYENINPVQMFCFYQYGNQFDKYLGYFYYNSQKSQYRADGTLNTSSDNPLSLPTNISGTLDYCLNYISQHFRNVNIYVDGIPWALVFQETYYNIGLGTGTYLIETNLPIEYKFDVPVYVDISDLINKIDLAIDHKIKLDFPYLEDLIVDTNGQHTIAVTVFSEDYTIDDLYVKDYGAMIPLFPLWVEYPVSLSDINTVATIGIVDVIPQDIIEIFSLFFIAMLLVFICHRLME